MLVYFWRILVRNLASWYVAVPQAETMGHIGQLALWTLGKPPSQIPGLNLTQFDNFRPNSHTHIPRCSTQACRARNLQN